tara:strand:- start:631 stop:894 length:264 start_codon:yes stop_codon:yes gene_type:complete
MINQILKYSASIFFSIFFLAIPIFLTGAPQVQAVQMSVEESGNNTMDIVIEESVDNSIETKTSAVPDLGDDQAFPFIPGFGKNSGKD